MNVSPGVSVVLCCHNSAARIRPTLDRLRNQKIRSRSKCFEVILVDNNCTDDTVARSIEYWKSESPPFPLQIVKECRPGLNFARQTGWNSAKFETIVFCDDDNWLAPDYLLQALELTNSFPETAIFGGEITAFFEIPEPAWFDAVAQGYAVGQDFGDRILPAPLTIYGAGMVISKTFLSELTKSHFTFLHNDREGSLLTSGGDTELCYAARKLGFQLRSSSKLKLSHFIPKERLTTEYAVRLWQGFGASQLPAYAERLFHLQHQSFRNCLRKCSTYHTARIGFKYLVSKHQWKRSRNTDFQEQLNVSRMRGQFLSALLHFRSFRNKMNSRIDWLNSISAK